MSNLKDEIEYGDVTTVLRFVMEQMVKGLYTAMPGIIESYDPTTKRARVRPAIKLLLTDGSTVSRPTVVNVPVLQPSGGGFVINLPVKKGDAVLCVFSQRGLSNFKQKYSESNPDEALLDLKDAVAIPGFGGLSITPSTTDGISMQNETGTNFVNIENGTINITSTGQVNVTATEAKITAPLTTFSGNVQITGGLAWGGTATKLGGGAMQFSGGLENTGGDIVSDGVSLETHTHGGVQTGSGNTGEPN